MPRNLFLTRTSLGVYGAILTACMASAGNLATTYDTTGRLKATDWVFAAISIGGTIASQLIVLGSRLDPERVPTFTPHGLPGPNKEDV